MRETCHAGRTVIERTGFRSGERNELGQIARRQAGIDDQHVGLAAEHGHGREVLDWIVRQVGVQTRRNRMRARGGEADGVAVRRCLRDRIGADIAARAGAVLDDDLLAEPLPKFLRDDPRNDVRAGARREGHHQTDRPFQPSAVAGLGSGRTSQRDHAQHT